MWGTFTRAYSDKLRWSVLCWEGCLWQWGQIKLLELWAQILQDLWAVFSRFTFSKKPTVTPTFLAGNLKILSQMKPALFPFISCKCPHIIFQMSTHETQMRKMKATRLVCGRTSHRGWLCPSSEVARDWLPCEVGPAGPLGQRHSGYLCFSFLCFTSFWRHNPQFGENCVGDLD